MKNNTKCMLFVFVFLAQTNLLLAQNNTKIIGSIADDTKKNLPFANVSLLKGKDSSLIKIALTDSLGHFEFDKLKPSTYLISVSFVGFKSYFSKKITVDSQTIELSPVILAPLSNLNEVTVLSKKTFIERKLDRIVVNPEALIANAGTSALEVLEKSPGIQLDGNGMISLRGRSNVVIFVDDKPTRLSAAALSSYLRGIPSNTIEAIEIMVNPPAKYDAAGNAGVINIRLKKSKLEGFNGNLSMTYAEAIYRRTINSFNFNYRVNKINFFSSVGFIVTPIYQDLTLERRYFDDNGALKSTFSQNSKLYTGRTNTNLKMGVDYYISKKTSMGVVFSGFYNYSDRETPNTGTLKNAVGVIDSTIESLNKQNNKWLNGSINLNFNHKLDKKGSEITANADYSYFDFPTNSLLENSIFLPNQALKSKEILKGDLPATIDIKTAKLDYSTPLKKGGTFEMGVKTSLIKTNNSAEFFNGKDNIFKPNYELTNYFLYDENINAAYVNVNKTVKKWSLQAGLRFEKTDIKGNQLGNAVTKDSSFTRNYAQVFPTFYASRKLDTLGKHQLTFSFGKRIDRPDYQALNPFTYPVDKFTYYSGNPFLRPTFGYNFELAHTYKSIFTTTVLYGYEIDNITETIDNRERYISRPGNIDNKYTLGFTLDATISPKTVKWLTVQLHTDAMNIQSKGKLYGLNLNNQGSYWGFKGSSQIKANKLWTFEISGSYTSAMTLAQFVTIPTWMMRFGAQTKVLKDRGTLRFNLADAFHSYRPGGTINTIKNSSVTYKSWFDSRGLSVVFTYRFTKGQNLKVRQSGGANDEVKRVKTS
jgi:iron complex outermembrane recepter protein